MHRRVVNSRAPKFSSTKSMEALAETVWAILHNKACTVYWVLQKLCPLQEAEVSRAVNLLFTHKRLFWTVLGTPCASTNTHSEKEPNSERDMRPTAVERVRNHSAVPEAWQGPSERCENYHSLTQLYSAGCFHLTDYDLFLESPEFRGLGRVHCPNS